MTDRLPPQLLALFQPRPPLRWVQPQDDSPETRATNKSEISGLAAFMSNLSESKENDDYEPTESWLQQRDRKRWEKQQYLAKIAQDDFEDYKPDQDSKIKGDAAKTLFVARLSYDTKESDLEREFGRFGPIERIRIIKDEVGEKVKDESGKQKKKTKPHRGYAFIVYEREKDMRGKYLPNHFFLSSW